MKGNDFGFYFSASCHLSLDLGAGKTALLLAEPNT